MADIFVDGLTFSFPDGWKISKYDDWSYYRRQFSCMWAEIKSLDLLAVDLQRNGWLIEVKDYRIHQRTKPSDLAEEVAKKVFDTLAALPPARVYANNDDERGMAQALLKVKRYRVVLHLEQPTKSSKLFPRVIDPAKVKQKLRKLLKPIDSHPMITEMAKMYNLCWSVV